MQTVKTLQNVTATGPALFNLVRSKASNTFKDRIPAATQDNIKDIATALFDAPENLNEYSHILLNQIGRIKVDYAMFTNPMAVLKKGRLDFGDTIEDIFVDMPEAHDFSEAKDDGSIFKNDIPKSIMAFYTRNYRVFYTKTLTEDNWRAAFQSWGQLDNFINAVFATFHTASQNDEFLSMMQLINQYGTDGRLAVVKCDAVTDKESAENLLVKIKATANRFKFPSAEYNSCGVLNTTAPSQLTLIISADADAFTDVKALAAAFNVEYQKMSYRKIVVPSFGDSTNAEMKNVQCVLIDDRFFQVYDCLERVRWLDNPENLTTKYWYHFWKIMFVCPWAQAVAFTAGTSTISGVTVAPASTAQSRGATVQCSATVSGTGLYNKAVSWNVSGNSDTSTEIDENGTLHIGANEAGPITVTATSVQDTTKNGTAEYTIS